MVDNVIRSIQPFLYIICSKSDGLRPFTETQSLTPEQVTAGAD